MGHHSIGSLSAIQGSPERRRLCCSICLSASVGKQRRKPNSNSERYTGFPRASHEEEKKRKKSNKNERSLDTRITQTRSRVNSFPLFCGVRRASRSPISRAMFFWESLVWWACTTTTLERGLSRWLIW